MKCYLMQTKEESMTNVEKNAWITSNKEEGEWTTYLETCLGSWEVMGEDSSNKNNKGLVQESK
jgi:hypothetical protein